MTSRTLSFRHITAISLSHPSAIPQCGGHPDRSTSSDGLLGRGEQEVDVCGRLGGCEGVVRRCEACGAALARLRVHRGGEEREVVDPDESEVVGIRRVDEALRDGGFVQREAQVAQRGGAAGEGRGGTRLYDEEVAVFDCELRRSLHNVLVAKRSEALHGSCVVAYEDAGLAVGVLEEGLAARAVQEVGDELPRDLGVR